LHCELQISLIQFTGARTFRKVVRLKSRRQGRRGRAEGASIGADGGEVWERGIPSPMGVGSGEGAVPPPLNFFYFFCVEIMHFKQHLDTQV